MRKVGLFPEKITGKNTNGYCLFSKKIFMGFDQLI
jgi:hypothetical protein